jgi:cobalt-zinc-cadmium efflux system membrane fusion protein
MKLQISLAVVVAMLLAGCDEKPATTEKAAEVKANIAAISPAQAKASNIKVETAGAAVIRQTMTLYGSVRPNGEREQSLRARYPGTVRTVSKSAGDKVVRGETLITVESSESLQTYAITAPISGTVLERKVNPGETVGTDAVLMTVADLSSVWIDLAVFARDLGEVRAGQPVRITTADGHYSAETQLSFVAPAGDAENQSVVARAVIENSGEHRWIPGQFVTGQITLESSSVPLAVPVTALQTMGGKQTVFVQTPQGFEARTVETGRRSQESVEIARGLSAGEHIAATNSYLLKAELLKGEAEEE